MRGRSQARQRLKSLLEQPRKLLIVHYSCESLNEASRVAIPKITSIAVKEVEHNQARSFAPQFVHLRLGIEGDSIAENFDIVEKEILREFSEYVYPRSTCNWLTWKMRDAKFGFAHLEQRSRALGLVPTEIPMGNRYDLSDIFYDIYGPNYSDHPRLTSLMRKNSIDPLDFLSGEQEVQAFRRGEFNRFHHSTLRKVEIIHQLAALSYSNRLVTNKISWTEQLRALPRQWPTIRGAVDVLTWIWRTARLL